MRFSLVLKNSFIQLNIALIKNKNREQALFSDKVKMEGLPHQYYFSIIIVILHSFLLVFEDFVICTYCIEAWLIDPHK
jgi:hypothetical protein